MDNTNFIDSEGHIIKTSSMRDQHQIIKITEKTPELKNIGKIVCGDTNSNILTFEIDRYYDGVDLYTKNIKFIVNNELGIFTEDSVNLQYNSELLRFSWILSESVTYKSGAVTAAIIFTGTESGQNYALKTVPFTINVDNSPGFVNTVPPYKNWFADIEARLCKLENNNPDSGAITAGKSAYEIAKDNGFEGTEQDWLDSLIGKSAYQIAVKNGFEGTEQDWLDSLKAETGNVKITFSATEPVSVAEGEIVMVYEEKLWQFL